MLRTVNQEPYGIPYCIFPKLKLLQDCGFTINKYSNVLLPTVCSKVVNAEIQTLQLQLMYEPTHTDMR